MAGSTCGDDRLELLAVHLPAFVLAQAAVAPGLLGGAARHSEDHLVGGLFDVVLEEQGPGIEAQDFEKTLQAFLLDLEAAHQIARRQPPDPRPDPLVEQLGVLLAVLGGDVEEPEAVHDPVVPQQKGQVAAELVGVAGVEARKVHAHEHTETRPP